MADSFKLRRNVYDMYTRLPKKIAAAAGRFVIKNFRDRAWNDGVPQPWPQRKAEQRKNSRALLVKSGRLRRGTRTSYGYGFARVSNDTPYAGIHNEGGIISGTIAVQPFTRKEHVRRSGRGRKKVTVKESEVNAHKRNVNINMPRRRFMGPSRTFNDKVNTIVTEELNKIENKFIKES